MLRIHYAHVVIYYMSFFTSKQSSLQVNNICCHYYFGMPIKLYLIVDRARSATNSTPTHSILSCTWYMYNVHSKLSQQSF